MRACVSSVDVKRKVFCDVCHLIIRQKLYDKELTFVTFLPRVRLRRHAANINKTFAVHLLSQIDG